MNIRQASMTADLDSECPTTSPKHRNKVGWIIRPDSTGMQEHCRLSTDTPRAINGLNVPGLENWVSTQKRPIIQGSTMARFPIIATSGGWPSTPPAWILEKIHGSKHRSVVSG